MAAYYDRMLSTAEDAGLRQWRADLLGDLNGEVLEASATLTLGPVTVGPHA